MSHGDTLTVDIWVANQYGTTEFADGSAESLGGQASNGFTGRTAEFIIERQLINGQSAPLAFFTPTLMQSCSYGDALYGAWQLFMLGPDNGVSRSTETSAT